MMAAFSSNYAQTFHFELPVNVLSSLYFRLLPTLSITVPFFSMFIKPPYIILAELNKIAIQFQIIFVI